MDPVLKIWESGYAVLFGNPICTIDPYGDDGYIDKEGNFLGDDGNTKSHETRVISSDVWKKTIGSGNSFTEEMKNQLIENSKLLTEYEEGVRIEDYVWKKLEEIGCEKIDPYIKNYSNYTIYFKPEYSSASKSLAPHKDLYCKIDGVAATHLKKNTVFKQSDGIRVRVGNTSLTWTGDNWGYSAIQTLFAGWKDESWLNEITANEIIYKTYSWKTGLEYESKVSQNPDTGWINLFKNAGLTKAEEYRKKHSHTKIRGGW